MFNLEQSIAEWRQKMLAAGIKPESLDELESHLREEIQAQIKLGTNEKQAIETAVSLIGRSMELRTQFAREMGLLNLLFGDDEFTRTNRILAILWLLICLWYVANSSLLVSSRFSHGDYISVIVYGLAMFIYGAGSLGSALLFCGCDPGRNVIRFISCFGIFAFFIGEAGFDWWPSTWANSLLLLVFNFLTMWLLQTRRNRNSVAITI